MIVSLVAVRLLRNDAGFCESANNSASRLVRPPKKSPHINTVGAEEGQLLLVNRWMLPDGKMAPFHKMKAPRIS